MFRERVGQRAAVTGPGGRIRSSTRTQASVVPAATSDTAGSAPEPTLENNWPMIHGTVRPPTAAAARNQEVAEPVSGRRSLANAIIDANWGASPNPNSTVAIHTGAPLPRPTTNPIPTKEL